MYYKLPSYNHLLNITEGKKSVDQNSSEESSRKTDYDAIKKRYEELGPFKVRARIPRR